MGIVFLQRDTDLKTKVLIRDHEAFKQCLIFTYDGSLVERLKVDVILYPDWLYRAQKGNKNEE